jgi:hypothetical protein
VDVEDLAARFADATLPKAAWTYEAHLLVGLVYVERYGPSQALERLRTGIRRLNDRHGTPNTSSSGYHETITRAYVTLLAEYLSGAPTQDLQKRAAQLLTGALASRHVLLRYYSRGRLLSRQARARWVEPDLAPLRLPAHRRSKDRAGATLP